MNASQTPTRKEIEDLITFLPRLYAQGFNAVEHWHGGKQEGSPELTFPWPAYNPLVTEFFRAAGQDCWSDTGYDPQETGRLIRDAEYIKGCSLDQIRTLLTYCVRGERFCDSHWGAMVESGAIRRLLERLAQLVALM